MLKENSISHTINNIGKTNNHNFLHDDTDDIQVK